MGSQDDADDDKNAKNGIAAKEATADNEAPAVVATHQPAAASSAAHDDKLTAVESSGASSSPPADSKKRKDRSEDDSTPSSKTKNCKPTPATASENPTAASSNDTGTTTPVRAIPSPQKDAKFPVHVPTPLHPTPTVVSRSQHLADKTPDDMPPEIRKVFLEIQSDPRWKFAFFPCK